MTIRSHNFASTTSLLALSLSMMGYGRGAYAGDCTGGPNDFYCTGPADPASDTTQVITVTGGDLTVTSDADFGLYTATGDGMALTTTADAGALYLDLGYGTYVSGLENGITVEARGSGAATVVTGDVTAEGGSGIEATNSANGTDMIVATGHVIGGAYGIDVTNHGTGALSVYTMGAATASGEHQGISAENHGTDLAIANYGLVTSGRSAIVAENNGSGALTIHSIDAIADERSAIFAYNVSGTDLSVTSTGLARGGSFGVAAVNAGTGDMTLVTHDVEATEGDGIYARTEIGSGALSITSTGQVSGDTRGVFAINLGSGGVDLSFADVYSRQGNGFLVYDRGADPGVNLAISGDVDAGFTGVAVDTAGAASIVTQSVQGQAGAAIYVRSETGLAIESSGALVGASGIDASNSQSGSLSISVGDITSYHEGIDAFLGNFTGAAQPEGDLTITATGTITTYGLFRNGVDAASTGNGTIDIDVVDVTTGTSGIGIDAAAFGQSELAITSTGNVTGGRRGINAYSNGDGDIRIDVVDVSNTDLTGGFGYALIEYAGIHVERDIATSGAIDITATGTVHGQNTGIFVTSTSDDNSTILTDRVIGQNAYGIFVSQTGTGRLEISSTDEVAGGRAGLRIGAIGGGASITVNNLYSSGDSATPFSELLQYADDGSPYFIDLGRFAGLPYHRAGYGILVDDTTYDDDIYDGPGTATSGTPGTQGALDITITGHVESELDAIQIVSVSQAHETIDIADTAVVFSHTGNAIDAGDVDTHLRVAGVVAGGEVRLNGGSDSLLVTGPWADMFALDRVDGGDDFDVLTFDNTLQALTLFENFEDTLVTNFSHVMLLDEAFSTGTLVIDETSLLTFGGDATVTADMSGLSGGLVASSDHNGTNQLTVNGDFAGAALSLGVALDGDNAADRLVVNGDTNTGAETYVFLDDIGSGTIDLSASPDEGILLVDVNGASSEGDFQLASGPLAFGPSVYDLARADSGDFFFDAVGLSNEGLVYPAIAGLFEDYWSQVGGRFGPPETRDSGSQLALSSQGTVSGGTGNAFWFRLHGGWSKGEEAFSASGVTEDARTHLRFGGFEIGTEIPLAFGAAGHWAATTTVGYVDGTLDVDNASTGASAGSAESTAMSTTFGLSYADAGGVFAHAELGLMRGAVEVTSAGGVTGETRGQSLAASFGLGRSLELGGGLVLAPSGQVAAIHTRIDSFTDSAGQKTEIDDRMIYRTRLGVDAFRTIAFGASSLTLQGGLFVEHQTAESDRKATIAGASVEGGFGESTSGEVSMGLEWTDSDGATAAWTQVRYSSALRGKEADSLSAAVGLEIRF